MRIRLVLLLYVFVCVAVCGADRRGLIDGLRRYDTITETNCRLGAEQRLNVTYDGRKWKAEADLVVHLANTLTSIITAHPEIVDRTALIKKLPANELERSAYEDTLWLYHFADDVVAQERVSGARICFGNGVYLDRSGNPYDDFCVYAKTLADGTTALSFLHYEYTKSEWYARAKKTALDHLKQPFPWVTSEVAYLFYMGNRRIPVSQSVTNETSPYLRYENSTWSRPYFDCGGTNRWIISNSIGFFGKSGPDRSTNDVNQKRYLGLVSIDIDLSLVDLNQCDSDDDDDDDDDQFRGSHLCRRRTSECQFISGRGFVRSSYACLCLAGYYLNMDYSAYRFTDNNRSGINGSALETREVVANDYCLPCPAQCPDCRGPCVFYIATWVRYTVLCVSAVAIVAFALAVAYVIARRDKTLIATGNPPLLALMIVGAATVSVALCVRVGADETASACLTFRWIFHLGFALFYLSLVLHAIETVRAHRHKKRGNGNNADDKSAPFANESRRKEYLTIMIIYAILCIILLSIWTWKSRPELRAISVDNDLQVCVEDDVTFLYASYVFHAAVLFFAGIAAAVKVYGVPTNFIASRLTALCIASSFALGGVVLPVLVGALEKSAERNRYLALIAFLLHVTCDVPPALLIGSRIYFVARRKDDLDERQEQKSKPRHAVGLVGVFIKPSDSDNKARTVSGSGSTSTRMTGMSSTSDACADDAGLPMTDIKELRSNRRRSADAATVDAAAARKHHSRRRKSWSTLAAHWLDWRRDSVDSAAAAAAAAAVTAFEDIAENPTGEQMPEPIMGETNKVVPPRDDVFGEEIIV